MFVKNEKRKRIALVLQTFDRDHDKGADIEGLRYAKIYLIKSDKIKRAQFKSLSFPPKYFENKQKCVQECAKYLT